MDIKTLNQMIEELLKEHACMNNARTDVSGSWTEQWKKLLETGKEGDYIPNIAKNKNILGKKVNLVLGNINHGLIHFINEHMWETINGELVNFKDLIDAIPTIITQGTPLNKIEKSLEGKQYIRIQTIKGVVNNIPCEIAIETHKERSLAESPMPTPWIISAYYKDTIKMSSEEIEKYRKEHYYNCNNEEIVLHLQ